jgi:hypothetical protein
VMWLTMRGALPDKVTCKASAATTCRR